jgi:deoxyribodipyrimidine photo-lyase
LTSPIIVWFRDDLRLADHPALAAAADTGRPALCLYVNDHASAALRPLGGAARWWLAQSLGALDRDLRMRGTRLCLRAGSAADVVTALAKEAGANAVYWNRRHDPAGMAIDAEVARRLAAIGVETCVFDANLLHAPDRLRTGAGTGFSVFTPFWRRLLQHDRPRPPLPAPRRLEPAPVLHCDDLASWRLEPRTPDWAGGLRATWTPGEAGARKSLAAFVDQHLAGYAVQRDRPDLDVTSRLSPHLRFGEISPVQVWHAVKAATEPMRTGAHADADKFLAELGWREFCHHLLHHRPELAERNLQPRFDDFAWRDDAEALAAWQRGQTGYPLVDAGMRQLWTTGWMHNRVRMVAASFLVKHLLIDWRRGEQWFWDTLVDADPANNPAGWQWVAGCGADAAPFFRIFNPVTQSEKFDPRGVYLRRWVPEIAALPDRHIHAPWTAAPETLASAGVALGTTYPRPIVDHAAARARALAAFARLRKA